MKYAENTEIGLGFGNPTFDKKIFNSSNEYQDMYSWLLDSKTTFMAISPNVMDISHKIKLKNNFSPNFLNTLEDGIDETYLLRDSAFRFKKIGNKVSIVYITKKSMREMILSSDYNSPKSFDSMSDIEKETMMLVVVSQLDNYYREGFLKLDFKDKLKFFDATYLQECFFVTLDISDNWLLQKEEGWDEWILQWIQLVIFVKFGEVDVKLIKPNSKLKVNKDKFRNESKNDIQIVTENWNTISIRTEGFSVSGHWRLQPCGKNNSQRKFKFINPYEKNGYVRKGNGVSKIKTNTI